ncbi:MAG: DUF6049 family protein [Candidatus Nanopelagicales bacterium]
MGVFLAIFLSFFTSAPSQSIVAAGDLELNFAEPNTPISGNVIRFGGIVANAGDVSLSNLGVRVFLSPAINSRTTLNNELNNSGLTPLMRDTGLRIEISDLAPDQRSIWSTAYLVNQLLADGDGVYLVGFQFESDDVALDFKKVAIPYRGSLESEITPVGISLLWPVASQFKTDWQGALPNEALPESLISTGRLANILRAGQGNLVSWVIDPALTEFLNQAGDGYLVKDNFGNFSPGQYSEEINLFLNGLQFSADSTEKWAMPFADADLSALARGEANSAFEQAITIARPLLENNLGAGVSGVVALSPFGSTPTDVIGDSYAQGLTSTIVLDTTYPPIAGTLFTPSGLAEVNTNLGREKILLNDSLLSNTFNTQVNTAEETVFFRQQLLADTFLVANQVNDPTRIIVVSPETYWSPTLESSLVIAQTLTRAPWVRPVLLSEILNQEVSNVLRSEYQFSDLDLAKELPSEHINEIRTGQKLLSELAAIYSDQAPIDGYAKAILQSSSNSFRANRRERESYTSSIIDSLTENKSKVQILAQGSVVLPGEEGSIPITIANDLDQRILVRLAATSNPEIRFSAEDLGLIEIEPGAKKGLTLESKVVGSGSIDVQLQLLTPVGDNFGDPVIISVQSAAYSQVATWIAGVAFVALILLSINSFRKRRKENV